MLKTLNSICADELIGDVIRYMRKAGMTVLPVVDHENKFVGTIYSKNILKNIIPEHYGFMESHRILYEINQAAEKMSEIKDRKVQDYMSTSTETVKETDNMNNLAHIMLNNNESILFVTNKNNKLRGYISRADLLSYLLNISEKEENIE